MQMEIFTRLKIDQPERPLVHELMVAFGQLHPGIDVRDPTSTILGRLSFAFRRSETLTPKATDIVIRLSNMAVNGRFDVSPEALDFAQQVQKQYQDKKKRLK